MGPICHHFGHQVCDFSMRIMPTKMTAFDGKFVFAARPGQTTTPHFFGQIVDYFGIPQSRLVIVNDDVIFETVHIAPQSETMFGDPPGDDYLDALERHHAERFVGHSEATPSIVYLSRGNMVRGAFAGEQVIEDFMRASGARIVYPEHETIDDLLRLYPKVEHIVIPEGSAQHTLQFLGRQLRNVVIIKRGQSLDYGEKFLRKRCRSLTYIDAVLGGFSGNSSGRYREAGVTILDPVRLLNGLRACVPIEPAEWREHDFRAAAVATVDRWITEYLIRSYRPQPDAVDIILREAKVLGVTPSLGAVADLAAHLKQ